MDTFEYKPALLKLRRTSRCRRPSAPKARLATFSAAPNRIIPPYWGFKQYGQSGRWISDLLPELATCVDDLAFIHGIKVDNNNHGPAVYHTLTGNQFPGSASIGAWVTYGLGSENRDLPGFIVMGDRRGADHRRRRCLGQRLSAGRVSGHAVPQRRYADRRSEPSRRHDRKPSSGMNSICCGG